MLRITTPEKNLPPLPPSPPAEEEELRSFELLILDYNLIQKAYFWIVLNFHNEKGELMRMCRKVTDDNSLFLFLRPQFALAKSGKGFAERLQALMENVDNFMKNTERATELAMYLAYCSPTKECADSMTAHMTECVADGSMTQGYYEMWCEGCESIRALHDKIAAAYKTDKQVLTAIARKTK